MPAPTREHEHTDMNNSASQRLFVTSKERVLAYAAFVAMTSVVGMAAAIAGAFSSTHFSSPVATLFVTGVLLVALGAVIFLYSFIGIALKKLRTAEEVVATARQSKERFALAGASEGVWDWNIADNTFFVSSEWKRLVGLGPDESITRAEWESRIHPDDLATVREAIAFHLKQHTNAYTAEYRVKVKGGSYKWVFDRGRATFDQGGKPIRMAGSSRDTSNAKNVEEVLKKRTEELEAAKGKIEEEARNTKKFQQAVVAATDAIAIMAPSGGILFVNPAWEKLTGYGAADVAGKNFVFPYAEKTPHEIIAKMWEMVKRDVPFVSEEMVGKRPGGEEYRVEMSVYPVAQNGRTLFYTALAQDITKRKEIDKAKTEFVSLASHQLRTPLSAIRWYSEMLLAGSAGALTDMERKYIKEIYDGNRRMIELVSALLNVSRIDLGTFGIDPRPTNISELSESVLKELEHQIEARQIAIVKDYDPSVQPINIDPGLIRIVFQNLLSNAVKYTAENGEIRVSIVKEGNNILITVSDNGYGIPKDQQEHIFTKLFRADNAREVDPSGTGLGLYIVKAIMEKSGGSIRFESEENRGTTFYGILPAGGSSGRGGTKQLEQTASNGV